MAHWLRMDDRDGQIELMLDVDEVVAMRAETRDDEIVLPFYRLVFRGGATLEISVGEGQAVAEELESRKARAAPAGRGAAVQ